MKMCKNVQKQFGYDHLMEEVNAFLEHYKLGH